MCIGTNMAVENQTALSLNQLLHLAHSDSLRCTPLYTSYRDVPVSSRRAFSSTQFPINDPSFTLLYSVDMVAVEGAFLVV